MAMPGESAPHVFPTPVEEHATHASIVDQLARRQGGEHIDPHDAWRVGSAVLSLAVEAGVNVAEARVEARNEAESAWHDKSPFNPNNAAAFGSDAERLSAAEQVRGMANQALLTNKFLDGRQKGLAAQLRKGEITEDAFAEASGAIMTGLAIMNPKKLEQVNAAQEKAIAKRIKGGKLPPDTEAVRLTSRTTENGMELAGIDAIAAKLVGVDSHEGLRHKGLEIKRRTYGAAAFAIAERRFMKREAELTTRIFEVQNQQRQTESLLAPQLKGKKKKKYADVNN